MEKRVLLAVRDAIADDLGSESKWCLIASQASYSPFHLHRAYVEFFGETPQAFRVRMRLELAKRLLASGHWSVSETCAEVGYASLPTFVNLFRRQFGLSPGEFREQARKSFLLGKLPTKMFLPLCFVPPFAFNQQDSINLHEFDPSTMNAR